jgi:uncharacterized protein YciI
MKQLLFTSFLICIFSLNAQAQSDSKKAPEDQIDPYWFVMIKTGPNEFDSLAKAKLFKGHMENMDRLYNEGILKVAGPFGKNDLKWRGIFILDCKTRDEAMKIVESDPAIRAGLFTVDVVQWYGAPTGSFKHGKPEKD